MSALPFGLLPWPRMAALALLSNRRDDADGCSYWIGPLSRDGYPQVRIIGAQYPAHRLTAALFYGPDAVRGKDVHHLCGHKACVNPEHLAPVTAEEHARAHGCSGYVPTTPPRPSDLVLFMDDVVSAVKRGASSHSNRRRSSRRAA